MEKSTMKLNGQDRRELRIRFDAILNGIEFDPEHRLDTLSKSVLEMLLFDYDPETKRKIVGWHTPNLCKIDLSKVDFTNVYFGDEREKNFDNTNIVLDIDKCATNPEPITTDCEGKKWYEIPLRKVRLKGVNLSGNQLAGDEDRRVCKIVFEGCNLEGTQLPVRGVGAVKAFRRCNLKGLDLKGRSEYLLNMNRTPEEEVDNVNFAGISSFENTGIEIAVVDGIASDWKLKKYFKDLLKTHGFDGCTIYDMKRNKHIYMKTQEEKKQKAQDVAANYERFILDEIIKIQVAIHKAVYHGYIYPYDQGKQYKFNPEAMERIRKAADEEFDKIPFDKDHRYNLPSNLMNLLLFDYHVDKDGNRYKTIGWQSDNLCKLNLNDYSLFEDVSFDCLEQVKKNGGKHINLNNTNAAIDLQKSYHWKHHQRLVLIGIDLEGVYFLQTINHFDILTAYAQAIIKSCSLKGAYLLMNSKSKVLFEDCDLSGQNLKDVHLTMDNMRCVSNYDLQFVNCNLSNTGIYIIGSAKPRDYKKIYGNLDKYAGCLVNGIPVKSDEEKREEAVENKAKYDKYSSRKISKIMNLVYKYREEMTPDESEED